MDKWYWISLHYATFGLMTRNGTVVKTAPIGKWMIGKSIDSVHSWVSGKRGKIVLLED